jgi:hypothetical protein
MENFEKQFNQLESSEETEHILQYAKEHYGEYKAFNNSEVTNLLNIVNKNRREFESNILPNVSNELVDKITGFVEGDGNKQIIAFLKQTNFDYETLLSNKESKETKRKTILEAVLKAQSYEEAVRQNQNIEIDFLDFDNDPDISDAKKFVYKVFDRELLRKCLISKIEYISDKINVQINNTDYILPVDVYAEWKKIISEVKNKKFRAENFTSFNTDLNLSKKFITTPIYLYSFYDEQPEQLDYLSNIPTEQKMRQYKIGTITHEIAHHIYNYLMDADKRIQWEELVNATQAITEYAKIYTENEFKYDEFFAEAVRLKTTTPDYLKINFPKVEKFLTDNFPGIKSVNIINVSKNDKSIPK